MLSPVWLHSIFWCVLLCGVGIKKWKLCLQ